MKSGATSCFEALQLGFPELKAEGRGTSRRNSNPLGSPDLPECALQLQAVCQRPAGWTAAARAVSSLFHSDRVYLGAKYAGAKLDTAGENANGHEDRTAGPHNNRGTTSLVYVEVWKLLDPRDNETPPLLLTTASEAWYCSVPQDTQKYATHFQARLTTKNVGVSHHSGVPF